jgi:hypothetical protein
MNPGLVAIAAMRNIHTLGIRGCDHATDEAIIAIAEGCTFLRSIDMMNLDYINVAAVRALVVNCPHLTTINCEGCNFTAKEFAAAVRRRLPFAAHVGGNKCRIEELPKAVVRYNKYAMEVQKHDFFARRLQKFGKWILSTYFIRLAKSMRRQQRALMQRVFVAFRTGTHISRKEGIQTKRHYGAIDLQRLMRRMYAVFLARRKARVLRAQRNARNLLQRCFRGFASRKRTTATFTRLYYFYNLLGHMAHKYVILRAARVNHRRILCVQAFARMIPPRVLFRILRHGVTCLQLRWRYYLFRNKRRLAIEYQERERQRLENIRRDAASRVIQRNWKATFFNKSMAPFILTCCIYFRIDYDEKKWNSTVMQRYWRGYVVRLKKYRVTEIYLRRYNAATKIQSVGRMRLARKHFLPLRRWLKRLNKRWRVLGVYSRPRLRLGGPVKVLQKYARRFIFLCRRHYAAIHIERIYRGHFYRCKWMLLIYQIHTSKVNKIKRAFELYKLRKMRKAQVHRRYMAAYKIWVNQTPSFFD